jgi:hypothetical protein
MYVRDGQGNETKANIFDLARAAQGKRDMLMPTARDTVNAAAYQQASLNYSGVPGATSYMNQRAISPISGSSYTPQYSQFRQAFGLSNPTNPYAGLSSSGKYGGFYTASDLESAIAGQAQQTRDILSSIYRDYANARYQQIDPALAEGRSLYKRSQAITGRGLTPEAKILHGEFSPTEKRSMIGKNNEYLASLNEWYAKNAAPAEQYLATAGQIESTPLSTLAASIASQQYGMNPYLAESKFAGLDTKAYTEQRDKEYIANYGMPYQQFIDAQTQAQTNLDTESKYSEEAAKRMIENVTGLNSAALRTSTGKSYNTLASVLSGNKMYTWGGGKQAGTAATALQEASRLLTENKPDEALSLVKEIGKSNQDLEVIISAILAQNIKYQKNFQDYLMYAPSLYGE